MNRSKYGAFVLLTLLTCAAAACDKKETGSVETKSVDSALVFSDPAAAKMAEAVAKDDAARVSKLLKEGANPNAVGDKGTSLLEWAMLNKSKKAFEALLAAGADTRHTDEAGDTVMHYAAKANDPAYLDILLAHPVDVNIINTFSGVSPLMAALISEREVQFQKLLVAGGNPNQTDRVGNTALHVAAKINEYPRVIDLLKAGADPTLKNRQGATFQRYLNMTPTNILSADSRRQREVVLAWLREHNIPIEEPGAKPG